jgi:DNA-binding LytR/AlgR family response regulator
MSARVGRAADRTADRAADRAADREDQHRSTHIVQPQMPNDDHGPDSEANVERGTCGVVFTMKGACLALTDDRVTDLVPVATILWVESYGNYVRVHALDGRYLHRTPIYRVACELAPYGFRRVHRKTVVNVGRVTRIRRRGHWCEVVLDSGHRLRVSRSHQEGLVVRAAAPGGPAADATRSARAR